MFIYFSRKGNKVEKHTTCNFLVIIPVFSWDSLLNQTALLLQQDLKFNLTAEEGTVVMAVQLKGTFKLPVIYRNNSQTDFIPEGFLPGNV